MPSFVCPDHGVESVRTITAYRHRWDCPVAGCTWRCWDGQTSTPADNELCQLRAECHRQFDALPYMRRQRYKWLAETTGLSQQESHIGMFSKEQCRELLRKMEDIQHV